MQELLQSRVWLLLFLNFQVFIEGIFVFSWNIPHWDHSGNFFRDVFQDFSRNSCCIHARIHPLDFTGITSVIILVIPSEFLPGWIRHDSWDFSEISLENQPGIPQRWILPQMLPRTLCGVFFIDVFFFEFFIFRFQFGMFRNFSYSSYDYLLSVSM